MSGAGLPLATSSPNAAACMRENKGPILAMASSRTVEVASARGVPRRSSASRPGRV
jgi:hypothetical protein